MQRMLSGKDETKCGITLNVAATNTPAMHLSPTVTTSGIAVAAPGMHRGNSPPGKKSLKNLEST